MDVREGGRLRHGQVRQEEGEGQLEAELRDALSGGEGVPVQVSRRNEMYGVCSICRWRGSPIYVAELISSVSGSPW